MHPDFDQVSYLLIVSDWTRLVIEIFANFVSIRMFYVFPI